MMKNKYIEKIFTIMIITIVTIFICMPKIYSSTIKPSDITGDVTGARIEFEFMEDLGNVLTTVGIFLAVGVMMIIGIKYMSGSLEEKAQYKKTMVPYLVGCILLFGASILAPKIIEIFEEAEEAEDIGNIVLGLIQVVGTFLLVGALMILGVKYMVGSTEERASYKKTILPYVIGAVLLFGAVNLTAVVYETLKIEDTKKDPSKHYCEGCGIELTVKEALRGRCINCQRYPGEGIK